MPTKVCGVRAFTLYASQPRSPPKNRARFARISKLFFTKQSNYAVLPSLIFLTPKGNRENISAAIVLMVAKANPAIAARRRFGVPLLRDAAVIFVRSASTHRGFASAGRS